MAVAIDDTIVAISTAVGEGGIGIVRMSGDKSLGILNKVFKHVKGKETLGMKSYTMRYGHIIDTSTGETVDEVIVSFMKAPNTYTREDVVEIYCHGGMVAVRKILSILLKNGARLAEPGEFTKRAFLNGRIDLSQAEAVIDLIRAKTDESMKIAFEQSQGKLSKKIKKLMDKLLGMLAHVEAAVAFPEDDIENVVNQEIIDTGREIQREIDGLVESADTGKILREGLNTIIVGKPNVGKSSLLNEFLQEKRAIVTDIPGTTRDVIEEYINIKGIPVKLVDTAGIRHTEDIVERIGVERSKEYIDRADLIIFMIDASRPLENEDFEIIEYLKGKKTIVIVNKMDLPIKVDIDFIKDKFNRDFVITTSINTGEGIEAIKDKIVDMVFEGNVSSRDVYVTNVRHRDILLKAKESVGKGVEALIAGLPIDFASIDFRDAYLKLGEITGDTVEEDIIDRIFTDFCIGK
ncbi:tRNA uridine-5-carboxymethylaminomethyl(34) synthesis GTPase MnmE [Fonticella tunisiensis]|uniref:tRNA modification GTPase MnmE n=1 Tax=Fonticella tunisiensis TaxID=1096341 RepID=A0A4R7KA19_9CLOT|nr:tRNA uridine-5-carboxymethylaminomethyl(34) synthesis GTPase MnmE [Fonticella tunisiensis]TDT50493.1 tRNA modification GTPase trmE [Fonticella tunisiensis]